MDRLFLIQMVPSVIVQKFKYLKIELRHFGETKTGIKPRQEPHIRGDYTTTKLMDVQITYFHQKAS